MRRYWWVLVFAAVWIAVAATDARTVLPQETPTPDGECWELLEDCTGQVVQWQAIADQCGGQLWLCGEAMDRFREKVDAWTGTATAEHDAARRLVAEARATARTAEQDAHDLAHEIARCGRVVRWAGSLPEVRR
jgi:hypothetical protein